MVRFNYSGPGAARWLGRASRKAYDALQSELSDEEFLIAMGNRLRELEQERAAPAAIRWIKRNLFFIREETSLPGLDLKRLLRLGGQEVPDSLSSDPRYPVSYAQMSRLVAAGGHVSDPAKDRPQGDGSAPSASSVRAEWTTY